MTTLLQLSPEIDIREKELRGLTPMGMLEYWNVGMMGLKEFLIIRLFFICYPQCSTNPSFH